MKRFVLYFLVFILVASIISCSFLWYANALNEAELAAGEQTMGPGWTMFMGLLLAPIGGFVAMAIVAVVRRLTRSS